MRNTFIDTIIDASKTREDIFIISGDAGLGVFCDFKEAFPEKFLNLGVAEQNTASFASGLSLAGFKVLIYNIIPFVLYRCYEQVRNDICYQELPVVLIGIGSGITYAPQGMTHYSVEDIGLARTLPNLEIISPIDPVEAMLAAAHSLESKNPVYIRLAKRGEPKLHENESFDITIPQVLKKGSDIAILFHGSIGVEVMDAYGMLIKENVYPELISVPMLQPLNKAIISDIFKKFRYVISIEEHFENSGLGDILKTIYTDVKPSCALKTMGIPYKFIHEIKNTTSMRNYFGISAQEIVKVVKGFIRG